MCGGCRLLPTADGRWFALTLAREDDRDLLPALFGNARPHFDDDAIAAEIGCRDGAALLDQGRILGLAVALADEVPVSSPMETLSRGSERQRGTDHRPLVIDLSAIWAGPLAGHLFQLASADVVKVESAGRPDRMREGDAPLFALLNQSKASVTVDFSDRSDIDALLALIRRSDIVIEAARPRGLLQLGIDADALVRDTPGLVWLTLTGHGARGAAADWIGLGDDCGVAGGLSQARLLASGSMGFVGDAIADPLTGMTAALEGWHAYRSGRACRIGFSMSAIVAKAIADASSTDPRGMQNELRHFTACEGEDFPSVVRRQCVAKPRPLGADNRKWLIG